MWFIHRPKKQDVEGLPQHRNLGDAIEIIAHKEAVKEVAERAKAANQQLHDVLAENGFTLKIYLAAGGSPPKRSGKSS